jgi:hypothetical protein
VAAASSKSVSGRNATSAKRKRAAKPSRGAPSKSLSVGELLRADPQDTARMLQQLFCVLMQFAHRQQLSAKECRQAFTGAQRQVKRSPYRLADAVRFDTFQQIAELLATWYRDAPFLDERGAPKPLPIAGPKSFTALAARYLPDYPATQVADLMVKEKLLDSYGRDSVIPCRRAAIFAKPNPMMLDRIPVLVHGLMSTVAHNISAKGRAEGTRCEQSTTFPRLPVELIPAFNANVKAWAQLLLDKTDSWARQRGLPENSGGRRTARVGVEVFSFIELNEVRPASRSRPRSS